MGLFNKLKQGLSRTKKTLVDGTDALFRGKPVDDNMLDELEELLIMADAGPLAALALTDELREKVRDGKIRRADQLNVAFKEAVRALLKDGHKVMSAGENPYVILTVGVNGVGKTTTIGKLARRFTDNGFSVTLAAGDTFRAAAIEQLEIWADRAGASIVKHRSGADPAAVAFDAVTSARARGTDIVIIDTAGRLHTQSNLMEELKKIKRVISKEMPSAPHEILLVVDATSGQNAINQAKIFNEAVGITGLALTKLDGTAKGGIVLAINKELEIPVKLIGVGEAVEDLQDFDPQEFVDALFDAE
ncbi:MAG: signal recognition particle-docking protein FtsY [Nitrospira sp.]|nr:signal recognition particle-docking protein FtsY [bacterium]MBL7048399.1 signal recognition particle-docking protein FtsY [Nitrospira sp.]